MLDADHHTKTAEVLNKFQDTVTAFPTETRVPALCLSFRLEQLYKDLRATHTLTIAQCNKEEATLDKLAQNIKANHDMQLKARQDHVQAVRNELRNTERMDAARALDVAKLDAALQKAQAERAKITGGLAVHKADMERVEQELKEVIAAAAVHEQTLAARKMQLQAEAARTATAAAALASTPTSRTCDTTACRRKAEAELSILGAKLVRLNITAGDLARQTALMMVEQQ